MYGNLCLVTFCLLALVSRVHCSEAFTRDGNSYVSLFGSKPDQPSPGIYEFFVEKLPLVAESKAPYTELNKFGEALDYLFKFKYFQKVYTERLLKLAEGSGSTSDSVPVPNYFDSESGLDFKELIVHTFPSTVRGSKPPFKHDSLRSATDYKIKNEYISDNVLITGSFFVDGNKYFFIHRLSLPKYIVDYHNKRDPESTIYEEERVHFDSEDFVDTYDSSYSNSSEINPIVKKVVFNKVTPHALSALTSIIQESLKYQTVKLELEFVKKYERAIVTSLGKAGVEYVKGIVQANNGNDTFKSSDVVFGVQNPDAPLNFKEKTKDILFKGFLNYEGTSLVYENVSLSGGDRYYNMSQGIQFTYPQEGDKKAIVSCNIIRGSRVLAREFKVKSITIVSEYLADLSSKSALVFRNKEVFFNKAGFLVRFEIYDVDEIYNYIFGHVGNEIARAIQAVVEGTTLSPSAPSEAA